MWSTTVSEQPYLHVQVVLMFTFKTALLPHPATNIWQPQDMLRSSLTTECILFTNIHHSSKNKITTQQLGSVAI
jgi:hypothetical protein